MGGEQSAPAPPSDFTRPRTTPQNPEFDEPWRKMRWEDKDRLKQKLKHFKVKTSQSPYVRIMIVGEVGGGKSSFINSVNNAFQERITCSALVVSPTGTSFNKVYETHQIEDEDGSPLAFVFNEIMGLESAKGVKQTDITKALHGYVQEGYKFNLASALSEDDQGYRNDPKLEQQTFCLVYVMSATQSSLMDPRVIEQMKEIREAASKSGMPQVIIMTKPDQACPLVNKDLKKIYKSKKIKEKMQECSFQLGVPMNNIFPVKNYHEEIDTDDDMDVLILKALEQIVNVANDAQKKRASSSKHEHNSHVSNIVHEQDSQVLHIGQFDEPWRKMCWEDKDHLKQKLKDFKVKTSQSPYVRILIVGEVGAGKSSFINSVNNVFQERITSGALVDSTAGTSFTKVYETHQIEDEDGSPLAFVFNDVMGLEHGKGVKQSDITKALQGFVQEGYKFNPASALSEGDQGYRNDPNIEQQTFCLVYVLSAHTLSFMDQKVIEQMKHIREAASELGMPQVIIMTKPDQACQLVNKDLRKIYKSKKIKAKMQESSNLLGVPMNNIFPVKNYHEEIDTDDYMDVLILKALEQIVYNASDAQKKRASSSKHE